MREHLLAKRKEGLTPEESWLVLGLSPNTWPPLSQPAPFSREDPIEGLGHVPAVNEALFSLKPGDISDALETPQGEVIAVIEERLPFEEARFVKDHEAFRAAQLKNKQDARLAAWLSDLRTRARLKDLVATPSPS